MTEENQSLTIKVSEKKAVSIYSINRFPVTLYAEQWLYLLDHADEIRNFIHQHSHELAVKEKKPESDRKSKKDVRKVVPIQYIEGENGEQIIVPT